MQSPNEWVDRVMRPLSGVGNPLYNRVYEACCRGTGRQAEHLVDAIAAALAEEREGAVDSDVARLTAALEEERKGREAAIAQARAEEREACAVKLEQMAAAINTGLPDGDVSGALRLARRGGLEDGARAIRGREEKWWKPSSDPVRNLTKAGALIAAEIDRILRERDEDKRDG